jgi:hypothetical protein
MLVRLDGVHRGRPDAAFVAIAPRLWNPSEEDARRIGGLLIRCGTGNGPPWEKRSN